MGLGGFERYDLLREELLVLNARVVFVGFCFLLELNKNNLIWYKVYVIRMRYVQNVNVVIDA